MSVDYGEPDPVTGLYPFVPPSERPAVCRRLGCRMGVVRTAAPVVVSDADGQIVFAPEDHWQGVLFVHGEGNQRAMYPIPMALLDDANRDIWADIRPWIESLHDTENGRGSVVREAAPDSP
jgi:hypothetical protein